MYGPQLPLSQQKPELRLPFQMPEGKMLIVVLVISFAVIVIGEGAIIFKLFREIDDLDENNVFLMEQIFKKESEIALLDQHIFESREAQSLMRDSLLTLLNNYKKNASLSPIKPPYTTKKPTKPPLKQLKEDSFQSEKDGNPLQRGGQVKPQLTDAETVEKVSELMKLGTFWEKEANKQLTKRVLRKNKRDSKALDAFLKARSYYFDASAIDPTKVHHLNRVKARIAELE